jgi:hypothetical protein
MVEHCAADCAGIIGVWCSPTAACGLDGMSHQLGHMGLLYQGDLLALLQLSAVGPHAPL